MAPKVSRVTAGTVTTGAGSRYCDCRQTRLQVMSAIAEELKSFTAEMCPVPLIELT
jgi:hypothetical protein